MTGGGSSGDVTLNVIGGTGISVAADEITTDDSEIVHDDLSGFVANEHIDHSNVNVIAGAGMTGGGDITTNRTLNVVGGTGITANANDIEIDFSDSTLQSNISGSFTALSSSIAGRVTTEEGNVDTLQGITIIAGDGLTGGGNLSSNRTISVGGGTGITVNANDVAVDFSDSTLQSNISGSL